MGVTELSASIVANTHHLTGTGPHKVIALHGRFGDQHAFAPMEQNLTGDDFSYAFMDYRGCGGMKDVGGAFTMDEIKSVARRKEGFLLRGGRGTYRTNRLLLATGIFHLPPKIPDVRECLGHSMFFCKDCDGYRVRGKRIAICGANNEAVEYALGMLHYSPCVVVATNGEKPHWSRQHAAWRPDRRADRSEPPPSSSWQWEWPSPPS